MPLDFNPILAGRTVETGKAYPSGTYTSDSRGGTDMLLQILQYKFPELLDEATAKMTPEKPPNAIASYGGLAGDVIKGGAFVSPTVTYSSGNNPKVLDTPEMMEKLGFMMHEIYHARVGKAKAGDFGKGLGPNWKQMLQDAENLNFPSVGVHYGGGDNLEEFLATAATLKTMKAAQIQPSGRFKKYDEGYKMLANEYPWLDKYVDTWQSPAKAVAPPPVSVPAPVAPEGPGIGKRLLNMLGIGS